MAGVVEPKKALLRRGELSDWLGLAEHEITKLIEEGVLTPRHFRPNSRAFFVRKEVEDALLKTKEIRDEAI